MDDIERAVDDGVNTFKVLTRVSNQLPKLNYIDEFEEKLTLALSSFATKAVADTH